MVQCLCPWSAHELPFLTPAALGAQVMHIGANVGRITLAARWGPNLGEYMMHCHNNVHEDNDMFRAFMVRLCLCAQFCACWCH